MQVPATHVAAPMSGQMAKLIVVSTIFDAGGSFEIRVRGDIGRRNSRPRAPGSRIPREESFNWLSFQHWPGSFESRLATSSISDGHLASVDSLKAVMSEDRWPPAAATSTRKTAWTGNAPRPQPASRGLRNLSGPDDLLWRSLPYRPRIPNP